MDAFEARDLILETYEVNKKQAAESSGYLQIFYLGKMAGLQEAMTTLFRDDELSFTIMATQDDIVQSIKVMQAALDKLLKNIENGY